MGSPRASSTSSSERDARPDDGVRARTGRPRSRRIGGTNSGMRVRCTFCSAEYEAAVTRAALVLVDRCAYCRRARLEPAEAVAREERDAREADTGARPGE